MTQADSLQDCDDCVAPADAFALVGEERRLAILEALWRLETPARFTDVREAVGVDDSAHFNYHLGKLTGTFVRKTDDGYELRTAGHRVVQAVLAGSFTEHPEQPIAIDDDCTICGGPLSARYADEMLTIECAACGHGHGEYPFPPGGLHDRTDAEVLEAFDQRVRHLHCLAKDGVCPECNGRMETVIERGEECCLGVSLRADHVCQQCGHELCSAVGLGLLDHSAVASFYADHGVSLSDTPYWQLRWCVDDAPVTVLDDDPWRLRVDLSVDDETLQVVVDGDLAVVGTSREQAAPA
ncbi:MAG: ArsR family transcriptional regulator [Halobacteriales archaeon]